MKGITERIGQLSKYDSEKAERHGEVFTPHELINEMLDSLPPETWSDPGKTFLDPCSGKGNFGALIAQRLYDGLRGAMPDDEERYRHIVERQLFMCEIQEESARHIEEVFNPEGKYRLNLYVGDYLTMPKGHFREKYDHAAFNPPYNKVIWKRFVERALDQTLDAVVVIHPAIWRESTNHKRFAARVRQGIVHLHINDYEAFRHDKVAQTTDWYLFRHGHRGEQTVTYSNGHRETVDVRSIKWLTRFPPSSPAYRILMKVLRPEPDDTMNYVRGFKTQLGHRERASTFHKITDGFGDRGMTFGPEGPYRQCGGPGGGTAWCRGEFHYTEEPTEHQFEEKVVMAYAGKPRARYFSREEATGVVRGIYWLTGNRNLVTLLNSKMMWKLLRSFQQPLKGESRLYTPKGYGLRIPPADMLRHVDQEKLYAPTGNTGLQHLPLGVLENIDPDTLYTPKGYGMVNHPADVLSHIDQGKLETAQMTEEDLYRHFGLTDEEIEWAES